MGQTLIGLLLSLGLSSVFSLLLVSGILAMYRHYLVFDQQVTLYQSALFFQQYFQRQLQNADFWPLAFDDPFAEELHRRLNTDCATEAPLTRWQVATFSSTADNSCISHGLVGSDFLQIKRFAGEWVAPHTRTNRLLLGFHGQKGWFWYDDGPEQPALKYMPVLHEYYYVNQTQSLVRKRLIRRGPQQYKFSTDNLLNGVERLVFELKPSATSQHDPASDAGLLSGPAPRQPQILHYYALFRSLKPDPNYLNQQEYRMGDKIFRAPGDHYRRYLLHGTISLSQDHGRSTL